MIIQRLASGIKNQDWFVVMVEIMIVVVGIFMGLQVDDWNEGRKERIEEGIYLVRLLDDIETDIIQKSQRITYFTSADAQGQMVSDYIGNKLDKVVEPQVLLNALYFSTSIQPLEPSKGTMNELRATGKMPIIRNVELRKNLDEYYQEMSQYALNWNLNDENPYRLKIRTIIPVIFQRSIFKRCTENDNENILVQTNVINCDAGISDDEAWLVFETIKNDDDFLNLLNYHRSKLGINIWLFQVSLIKSNALALILKSEIEKVNTP